MEHPRPGYRSGKRKHYGSVLYEYPDGHYRQGRGEDHHSVIPAGNKLRRHRTGKADPDKQQIVQNIVAYAHPRSMQIIAEGVETAAELRKVIELGADALQGYFLAKPAAVPAKMAPAARKVIAEYSSASDSG